MPVGRTEDDGRPFRQYRGKPAPLGTLTEWGCPSCGQKVSGVAYENGCPHCGTGTPQANATPIREPVAAPASQVQPQPGPRTGMASGLDVGRRPVDVFNPAPALVVTRIIQYVCHDPEQVAAMELTLQRALVGRTGFAWGEIIAAIVDDVSPRQQDILSLARRQPGVWLGGPEKESRPWGQRQVDMGIVRYEEAPGREEIDRSLPFIGKTGMDLPNTGPEFTRLDDEMAKVLVQACGVKVAYTICLALQSLAAAGDDADPLILRQSQCYALANAIMQYIPKDYVEPDLPPPPPPNAGGPDDPGRDEARARVAAIQQASKPEVSFRE